MTPLLQQAKECFEQLSTFRNKRNRCRDYTYGRQWNDTIFADGKSMTEYEYIIREGNVPLKNNLIRRIVRNVLGVFRERLKPAMKELYGNELANIALQNSMEELFCRTMEEFLISGMAVHKKRLGFIDGQPGIRTEIVSPGSFFFNTDSRDLRGWDINLIGQIHRVDYTDWCRAFVKTADDLALAKKLFDNNGRFVNVTEVWRREMVPYTLLHDRESARLIRICEDNPLPNSRIRGSRKWILEETWRYYFLSDDGSVICQGDSPYIHGSHPYVVKCYPFLDGEIQSFVADMIDQQRYTNRLITMFDWVIRASAKGVLLVPEGSVDPEDMQGVADQWGRFNGVIVYKSDPVRPEPRQVSGNMANLGISELLEIQLKMLEDVSGVNGILQGNTNGGNVSGALYNSQTTNAMYSLSDLLETFLIFVKDCAEKDRLLLSQTFVV